MPKLPPRMKRGSDGVYRYRRTWNEAGQRREFKRVLGADYQSAIAAYRKLEAQRAPVTHRGRAIDAIDRWLESDVPNRRKARSCQKTIGYQMGWYVKPYFGNRSLDQVNDPVFLQGLRVHIESTPRENRTGRLSPAGVAHILSAVRRFFRWCEDSGYLDRARYPRRWLPGKRQIQPRARVHKRLRPEEAEAVAAIGGMCGLACRVGRGAGLRYGELRRARADHLAGNVLVVEGTKDGEARRVPLEPALAEEIRGRVGLLCPDVPAWEFNRAVRRSSGVKRFTSNMLRHTFAYERIEAGWSLTALQQMMGHANIQTTMVYLDGCDELVDREADRLLHMDAGVPDGVPGNGVSTVSR